MPPEPEAAPSPGAKTGAKKASGKAAAAKAPRKPLPLGMIGGAPAVVVVAVIGWCAYSKFMAKPAYDPAATWALVRQAQIPGSNGQHDRTIPMLPALQADVH